MYRKNTAGQSVGFAAINASTGATMTGTAGFAAYRVIDGGVQAAATGAVTDRGNGQYSFALSQADTNGNDISLLFAMTGMIAVEKTIVTTAADPTNGTTFGLANLDAAVSTRLATTGYTAPPSTGAIATAVMTDVSDTIGADIVTVAASVATLLTRVGGSLTIAGGKVAATLAAADVTGNVACDLQTIKTQAVTAAAGVTFPASIGTSTYAGGAVASVTAGVTVTTNNDKAGYALSGAGLDPVVIEAGVNARQALSPILAACAGVLAGAGTGTITIQGGNVATTRITAATDSRGYRTSVTLILP